RPTKFDGIESGKNLRSTHTSQERYNLNPHLLGDRIADDTVHRLESRPPRRTQKSQLHPPFPEPRPSYAYRTTTPFSPPRAPRQQSFSRFRCIGIGLRRETE